MHQHAEKTRREFVDALYEVMMNDLWEDEEAVLDAIAEGNEELLSGACIAFYVTVWGFRLMLSTEGLRFAYASWGTLGRELARLAYGLGKYLHRHVCCADPEVVDARVEAIFACEEPDADAVR
nr:hypothetical protein [uncultured bacterium]